MKVSNGNWIAVSRPDCIMINGRTITPAKNHYSEQIEELQRLLHIEHGQVPNIDQKPATCSRCDAMLLTAVGLFCRYVFCEQDGKKYEITFSYNFPIVFETEFIRSNINNIDLFADANLISLAECGDFLRTEVDDELKYNSFIKRNRRLIKKNDREIKIQYDRPLKEVLLRWQEYCFNKFDTNYNDQVIQAYLKVYSEQGFQTRTFILDGNVIAQGVTFRSFQSNTLYYCIFSWDESYKSKSPGIYAFCKAIQECHRSRIAFSFCYGSQRYKSNLLRDFL
ncbi:MAG: GNAT family N-acetyltransferase [Clostridia bacterium]|nr:GNAT family N-acetyltransferase [Clostridia bacterium]